MSRIIGIHVYSHGQFLIVYTRGVRITHDVRDIKYHSVEFTENHVLVHITWKHGSIVSTYLIDSGLLDIVGNYFPV
jgi:hypothetical protein